MARSRQHSAPALLLEHGYLLCLDDADTRGPLSLAVEDGNVAAIGAQDALRARFPGAERMSCRGRIVMPGLVNAHLHPELQVLKGALEDLGLHDWREARFYNAAIEYLGSPDGRDIQALAIRAALAEAALGGTTCVGTYGVTRGSTEACRAGLNEVGLRGTVTIRDEMFPPCTGAAGRGDGALPVFYRLHAEERLFEAELEAAARAHARGDHIVMHAAETVQRVRLLQQRFGVSTIGLLQRYGLLSPRVLLSHAIHVDAAEIATIAAAGTRVVVSPAAEMKLGDGIPAVREMLAAGVTVALGTDAAVCNNGADMFLEMRALGQCQKLRYGANAVSAEQILLTATRHGAAVLGGAGRFGALMPGMTADLILVDTNSARMQPLVLAGPRSNLAANLVYAATASDVTDVMVGGRWIVRRRRLRTMHTATLWRRVGQAARLLEQRLAPVT